MRGLALAALAALVAGSAYVAARELASGPSSPRAPSAVAVTQTAVRTSPVRTGLPAVPVRVRALRVPKAQTVTDAASTVAAPARSVQTPSTPVVTPSASDQSEDAKPATDREVTIIETP